MKALHWFRLAANQGDVSAQIEIGGLYEVGLGVPKDYAKAAHWLRLAARQGNIMAQAGLAWLYTNGRCAAKFG